MRRVLLLLLTLLLLCGLATPVMAGDEKAGAVGEAVTFKLTPANPSGGILRFNASDLPAGATLDPVTGVFSWTPTHDQVGVWVIRFTVSDGQLSDYEDVTITVWSPYDVNHDWAVNVLDLISVVQHLNEENPSGLLSQDVNRDGVVNILDLILVGQNFQ